MSNERRQELYDRIRAEGKQRVIVEEMIRHGFWPPDRSPSAMPKEEWDRLHDVAREVAELSRQAVSLQDPEKAKIELRRRRMAEAMRRRQETKQRREAERRARAEAWAERKSKEIGYLGEGMSGALGRQEGRALEGLPDVQSAGAIASAMGITVGELRWLTFHRTVSESTHYRRFEIPKKTGGTRLISAPMPRLKRAQRWVLDQVLAQVSVHDAAHGFVPSRSIVSNATTHVGRAVVVNLDLRDFFPTLSFRRVYGLFASLGYSPESGTILSLLCTEPEVEQIQLDGRRWFVHASERHLPQGSPCSPALTNLVCRRLDRRLSGLAAHLGFFYTRYADDLTFSSADGKANVGRLLRLVQRIVVDEQFVIHPDKTRVMRRGGRQEVTGLVVNDRLGVPRELLRRWRATLFQVRQDGPAGKRFGLGKDVFASLTGFAAFVRMVDVDRGQRMLDAVGEVAGTHHWRPPERVVREQTTGEAPGPSDPRPRWWEFWKWFR